MNQNPNKPNQGNPIPPSGYPNMPYPQPPAGVGREMNISRPPMGQQHPPMPSGKKNTPKKVKKAGNGKWYWLGILLFLVIAIGGVYAGYETGIAERRNKEAHEKSKHATEQFKLALVDIEAENYTNAKTRLEYVLQVDPNFPGASDKYVNVMMALAPKETPTPYFTPTPAPTPTPDVRGEQDMLNSIQENMTGKNWAQAIEIIVALRNKNIDFRPLDVDGMYYIALRNLGIQEIANGYLEQGVYDITLSEAFGPIDKDANGQRMAARNYLAGAGFWEVDWEKALEYYTAVYLQTPGIFDRASGLTATQRYVRASFERAGQYAMNAQNQNDYCHADELFAQGLEIQPDDTFARTATAVALGCHPPTPTQPIQEALPTAIAATPTVQGMAPPPAEPPLPPVEPPAEPPAPQP